ncbi:MAG: DUF418 domain-containing protein [Bacteroidia bacterium]
MRHTSSLEQDKRELFVDVLRGFALVGVLFANFNSFVEQQTPAHIIEAQSTTFDIFLMRFNSIFLEWKFMTLFSILFGYGFGLIIEHVARKNIPPIWFFTKRLFWLFIFGVVHCLFWWGDVLNLYAMSGIFLLLFRKMNKYTLLFSSLFLMLIAPLCIDYLLRNKAATFTDADINALYFCYKTGSLSEVILFNIDFYYRMFVQSGANYHDVAQTLGRFLLGYFLLRIRFFSRLELKENFFIKSFWVLLPLALGYFFFKWILIHDQISLNPYLQSFLLSIGILATTLFYVSILVIANLRLSTAPLFSVLRVLGKMTLTNYLLISLFLIVLMYGFALNKIGDMRVSHIWMYAIGFLMAEIILSILCDKYLRNGPAEWIWRQLTYGKRLPFFK